MLTEDGRLQRLSLGPERARVSVPALAVPREAGGPVRYATMEAEGLRLLGRVVVLRRRVLCHEQSVIDAAGRQQPATEGAEEAEAFGLVVPGPFHPDRRRPRESDSAQLASADVERTVDENVEGEAGARAELEHAHAARTAVSQRQEADACHLIEPTDPPEQLRAAVASSEELGHSLVLSGCAFDPGDDLRRAVG